MQRKIKREAFQGVCILYSRDTVARFGLQVSHKLLFYSISYKLETSKLKKCGKGPLSCNFEPKVIQKDFFGFQAWIRIQAAVGRSHSYYAGQNIDSTSTVNYGP
jgi:hypothetical protein